MSPSNKRRDLEMNNEEMKVEVSEDNLSARLSGGAIHLLSDALVSCFKGSGAINHLECNFEDPEDNEQYTLLMQKKSGISQGEKIAGLEQEVAELREFIEKQMPFLNSVSAQRAEQLLNK